MKYELQWMLARMSHLNNLGWRGGTRLTPPVEVSHSPQGLSRAGLCQNTGGLSRFPPAVLGDLWPWHPALDDCLPSFWKSQKSTNHNAQLVTILVDSPLFYPSPLLPRFFSYFPKAGYTIHSWVQDPIIDPSRIITYLVLWFVKTRSLPYLFPTCFYSWDLSDLALC